MTSALVGYTGFVGQTLLRQSEFSDRFNRSNIETIRGKEYSLVVCAAAPAAKWYANQHAEEDRANLDRLMSCLSEARAGRFVLVSTVDVYPDPVRVDESTEIDPEAGEPYGRHRFLLERFVTEQFAHPRVVRLPGLFGLGLKKNTIYDFLTTGASPYTHPDSVFQYYDMENLWPDLNRIMEAELPLMNMATEPIAATEIAWACSMPVSWQSDAPPVAYDTRTRYAERLGREGPYVYTAAEVLAGLKAFVERMRVGG